MRKATIIPLGENILIKTLTADQKTGSGIYLPQTASEEKPQQGKVIAVGESKKVSVKKNQTVIFNRYSGTEVKVDGEDYLIVKNEDVLAIVK